MTIPNEDTKGKCPICGGSLQVYESCCLDLDCCGIPHEIFCSEHRSHFEEEFWDYDEYVSALEKYGIPKEDED